MHLQLYPGQFGQVVFMLVAKQRLDLPHDLIYVTRELMPGWQRIAHEAEMLAAFEERLDVVRVNDARGLPHFFG